MSQAVGVQNSPSPMQSIPISTCLLTISAIAGVTSAAMTARLRRLPEASAEAGAGRGCAAGGRDTLDRHALMRHAIRMKIRQ
jgi:hypothetical protein